MTKNYQNQLDIILADCYNNIMDAVQYLRKVSERQAFFCVGRFEIHNVF